MDHNGVLPLPSYELEQYQLFRAAHLTENPLGNWTEVGPLSYPVNATGNQPTGMGRINAIAFHPTNAKILFAGASIAELSGALLSMLIPTWASTLKDSIIYEHKRKLLLFMINDLYNK